MSTIDPFILPSALRSRPRSWRHRLAAACTVSVLALGAAAAWVSAASAQDEADAEDSLPEVPVELVIDESGWVGNAFLEQTGAFSHCAIGRDYSEDLEVLFLMGGDAQLNMIVSSANFELEEGQEPTIRFSLDNAVNVEVPTPAIAPQSILIRIGNNPDVFQALRRGNAVQLNGEGIGTVRIPLTGTLNALPRLRACFDRARALEAEGVGLAQFVERPPGAPAAPGAPGAEGPQPGARDITGDPIDIARMLPEPAPRNLMPAESLLHMMDAAGMPIGAFVDPARIPLDEMDAAYMWITEEGLTGALHQRPRGRGIRLDAFSGYYMGIFESVCDGTYELTMGEPVEWDGEFAVRTAFAECYEDQEDGERVGDTVSVFFALDQVNYSAFIHLGRYAQRDAVQEVAEALQEYVLTEVENQENPAQGLGGAPEPEPDADPDPDPEDADDAEAEEEPEEEAQD